MTILRLYEDKVPKGLTPACRTPCAALVCKPDITRKRIASYAKIAVAERKAVENRFKIKDENQARKKWLLLAGNIDNEVKCVIC